MEPHAAPAQPFPATALCAVHVTFALPPETVAKNCSVLGIAPEGCRNAYGGEIATDTGPGRPAIVMMEAPLFDGSAWLVATSATGSAAGTEDGAT
jgi:hypothetical protein